MTGKRRQLLSATGQDYSSPLAAPGAGTPGQITAAELLCAREWLNVSAHWFAAQLGITTRTLQNWESERILIDPAAQDMTHNSRTVTDPRATVDEMLLATWQAEQHLTNRWKPRNRRRPPTLMVCRDDAELKRIWPSAYWPAGWFRALYPRLVRNGVPLRITYAANTMREQTGVPWGDTFRPSRYRETFAPPTPTDGNGLH